MHYQVIYNSNGTEIGWWFELPTLILLLVLILYLLGVSLRPRHRRSGLLFAGLILLFNACGIVYVGYQYYANRNFYRYYYGPSTSIEGVVKNYRVIRTPSSVGEQFDVNDIHFGYLDLFQSKCFHRVAANGGPIREGLPVRISYAGLHVTPCIVKLEVAEEGR